MSQSAATRTMKAVAFNKFGDAQELAVATLPRPSVKADEVLIRLHHTSVNPVDWKIRKGYLKDMLPHVFPVIPGWDAAGVVEQVGSAVSGFAIGDRVGAYARLAQVHQGTYAEYISVPASFVAKIPATINFAAAAGVPLVALTAWQALNDFTSVAAGQHVLILNGAGGVGSFAIQFAKQQGAIVTTTTGSKNVEYVVSLGADHVIDYTRDDVAVAGKKLAPHGFDFVLDAIGGDSLVAAYQLVRANGQLVSIVDAPAADLTKTFKATFHFVYPNGSQLQTIFDRLEHGRVKVPSYTVLPVTAASAAHESSEAHHTRGKVVLEIAF